MSLVKYQKLLAKQVKNFRTSFQKADRKKKVSALLLVLVVLALLYALRGLFVIAVVNGQPITRLSFIRQLEKQGGSEVLEGMITKALIEQEARKQNVVVPQADIDAQIAKFEESLTSQNLTLEAVLEMQGQTRSDLEDSIRINKLVEGILAKDITITDKEVEDYFNANKETFGKDIKFDDVKDNVRSQILQQKLGDAYTKWITEIKEQAKIIYLTGIK